ncbi:MAG TPA: hypothetical protein VK789_28370 [Bryobacteraceae bacterium]|nr:hypothetical protein [Bryobacteraceae bacterium]
MATVPNYWMHETGGELALAVASWLADPMKVTVRELGLLRAYVIQWIEATAWDANPHANERGRLALHTLRTNARLIHTPQELSIWLEVATGQGFDPL